MSPIQTAILKAGGGRQSKPAATSTLRPEKVMYYLGGILMASILVWCVWDPANVISAWQLRTLFSSEPEIALPDPRLGKPIKNWDSIRRKWLSYHPHLNRPDRILMITGSAPYPCSSPVGDHYLLRLFKNKVDYCRINNCEIFYNSAPLQPKMSSFWAKYPVIRSAMIAHPEVEWLWWIDCDAAISDMSFRPQLQSRYAGYNLVVQGWSDQIYGENKSWYGANAGVFFIRNCQWSMDLIEKWASMGPISPDFSKWGRRQKSVFPDKLFPESDDQTALLYLLATERDKWGDKVYIEESQDEFQLFWVSIIDRLKNKTLVEMWYKRLGRRRHERFGADTTDAEATAAYQRQETTNDDGQGRLIPFITHFPGCQPCITNPTENYRCFEGMEMVLNFADNQVLLNYGYYHPDLHSSSLVEPLCGL